MSDLKIRAMAAAATTTGTPPVAQNLDVSGGTLPNENPKAAIYLTTSCLTVGTIASHARLCIGMTDGTVQRALGGVAENNITPANADCQTRTDNASVINSPLATNGNIDGEAAWSSWRNNGSAISWTDLLAAAQQIGVIYFFGTEVQAVVREVTLPSTIGGTVSVTDAGFQPNLAIAMSVGSQDFSADTNLASWRTGIGFACQTPNGILQGGAYVHALDRAGTQTACAQSIYDTRLFRRVDATAAGGVTDGGSASMKSFESGGCTFETLDVAQGLVVTVLLLRVPHNLWVGDTGVATSGATGNRQITSPGFRPQAYFCIATAMASINSTTGAGAAGKLGFGVRTQDEEAHASAQAEDGLLGVNSDTRSVVGSDVAGILDDAGGVDYSISHVTFDDAGVTINMDDTSSSDMKMIFLFIGAAQVGTSPLYVPSRRRRRLTRL